MKTQGRVPGIEGIEYWLPENEITNEDLANEYGDWDARKFFRLTGIEARRVGPEPASDMAVNAAEKLFASGAVDRESVDFLIVVTQSGDCQMPATACIVQDKLRMPRSCAAFDINLGCSGYVYGLAVAKSVLLSGLAKRVLLITVEKVSHVHLHDRSARPLLGEAATATLVSCGGVWAELGEFDLGTDGSGSGNLCVPAGGTALARSAETAREYRDEAGNIRTQEHLYMNGMEIFNFSMKTGPMTIERGLRKNRLGQDDISCFILHQANKMILESLRKKLEIPQERFCIDLERTGNTSSCTIPIVLRNALKNFGPQDKILLCGFGIGYSWGTTVLTCRRKTEK